VQLEIQAQLEVQVQLAQLAQKVHKAYKAQQVQLVLKVFKVQPAQQVPPAQQVQTVQSQLVEELVQIIKKLLPCIKQPTELLMFCAHKMVDQQMEIQIQIPIMIRL
jgi:hypothetical protein